MKNGFAILALTMLIFIALACGGETNTNSAPTAGGGGNSGAAQTSGGAAAVESVALINAADETVTNFKPSDNPQKFAVTMNERGAGKVKAVFTAVNADGQKNIKLLEKEIELTSVMDTATFTVKLPSAFPVGDYKVDVFVGDKLAKTVNYKVQ